MSDLRHDSVLVRARDESAVGEVRRAARRLARELGLAEVAAEHAAIVASEACRNLVVHGRGGDLVLTAMPAGPALDVLALDRGPGIPDLQRAMQDGFSTAGTAGQGLGAIARIASVLDVYSTPGHGTALFARVGKLAGARDVGAICVPVQSERTSGDGWAVEAPGGLPVLLVVDGLGHGARAAEAAHVAVAAFRKHAARPAEEALAQLHLALRPTRGAALAVAEPTGGGASLRWAGIGNISGALVGSAKVRKMVSLPGTAGHEARSIRAFEYEWPEDALLIVHSDGVATHWDLAAYPGLALRHPAVVAGVLFRDFARARDDATVVVVRRGR